MEIVGVVGVESATVQAMFQLFECINCTLAAISYLVWENQSFSL